MIANDSLIMMALVDYMSHNVNSLPVDEYGSCDPEALDRALDDVEYVRDEVESMADILSVFCEESGRFAA